MENNRTASQVRNGILQAVVALIAVVVVASAVVAWNRESKREQLEREALVWRDTDARIAALEAEVVALRKTWTDAENEAHFAWVREAQAKAADDASVEAIREPK